MSGIRPSRWALRAHSLAQAIPWGRLHPAVLSWVQGREPSERWAIALSGGADSLALLLLLWAHFPEKRKFLTVLHFDHRLRGRVSAADARFCATVARQLRLRYRAGSWENKPSDPSEGQLRGARFVFFEKAMRTPKTQVLWLGHQQDDIAETLLMRLSRGSGSAGLSAPRPVGPASGGRLHVRPLLPLKKEEIVAALKQAGITWREDASNAGSRFFRNRLRQTVVPLWVKASGRDAKGGASLSRDLLEEDDTALEAWADQLKALTPAGKLKLSPLKGVPRAVVRRLLHRWLLAQAEAGELSRNGFALLLSALERGHPARLSLGTRGFAVIGGGSLRFQKTRNKRT